MYVHDSPDPERGSVAETVGSRQVFDGLDEATAFHVTKHSVWKVHTGCKARKMRVANVGPKVLPRNLLFPSLWGEYCLGNIFQKLDPSREIVDKVRGKCNFCNFALPQRGCTLKAGRYMKQIANLEVPRTFLLK